MVKGGAGPRRDVRMGANSYDRLAIAMREIQQRRYVDACGEPDREPPAATSSFRSRRISVTGRSPRPAGEPRTTARGLG
jgi:hypothetical protein